MATTFTGLRVQDTYNAILKIGDNTMIFASQGLRKKKNTLETYKFLESIGVKVNVINARGKNPLHAISFNSKDLAIYKYFINKGISSALVCKGGR